MDDLFLGLAFGIAAALILMLAIAFVRAGSLGRAWWGLGIAGSASRNPALGAPIDALVGNAAAVVPTTPQVVVPPAPPKQTGEALRLLALLQSEARLLDFLLEDVAGAPDAALGAGVREIHKKAAAALRKYLAIEPILGGGDGDRVTVQKGFDPSAIRVLGNVTGEPPYTGELQHPGWKVKELKLPTVAEGQDPFVLQPAEVQM